MASLYPDELDALPTTQPYAGHRRFTDAINAVQAELGTTPSGSYSTVAARLTALADAVVEPPANPAEITGVRGSGNTAILAALLVALDDLGLIVDSTTAS